MFLPTGIGFLLYLYFRIQHRYLSLCEHTPASMDGTSRYTYEKVLCTIAVQF